MRGIRGAADSYEEFVRRMHRTNERTENLDQYLEIFDTVELIQAGPDGVRESILIAINGAYRTGGMRQLGPGGEGGDPDPVFEINRLELRFNPMKRTGLMLSRGAVSGLFDADRIIRAACDAVVQSEIAYKGAIQAGLIICFARDLPWEVNRSLAEKIRYWKKSQKKIIGIDLAGPESVLPLDNPGDLERMAEVFDCAGDDLGRTVHVGETPHTSLDTFLATLRALKPQRVAHPVVAARAFWQNNDARGLELLAEMNICCELCVKSNLLTRALDTPEEYGKFIALLDDFGIRYTFSTDSPALQMTTLANEMEFLLEHSAITPEQLLKAFKNAEAASFLRA